MDLLPFLFESSIILGFSYGLYYVLLRKSRSFIFVRLFLIAALIIAVIIPFIEVKISENLAPLGTMEGGSFYALVPIYSEASPASTDQGFAWIILFAVAYFLGLSLMLFRFIRNLMRLISHAKRGECIESTHGRIVLTKEKTLPYSFFRTIFLNRTTYEKEEQVDQLLLHEGVHCRQLHSADILLVEVLKVLLWFNPFVWLLSNAMRLNHEYIADDRVQESQNSYNYQLLLINLELNNQSISLASEFNYSLTKKRLNMMNNRDNGKNAYLRTLATIPLLLALLATLTFCETEEKPAFDPGFDMEHYANDWWKPILEKHGIKPRAYNNFEFIFEMGSTNSIDENNVVSLTDAFFLIRKDESEYGILRSPLAYHNLETGTISGEEGTIETFSFLDDTPEPMGHMEMKNFTYKLVENRHNVSADYLELHEKGKEVVRGWIESFEAKDSLAIVGLD